MNIYRMFSFKFSLGIEKTWYRFVRGNTVVFMVELKITTEKKMIQLRGAKSE